MIIQYWWIVSTIITIISFSWALFTKVEKFWAAGLIRLFMIKRAFFISVEAWVIMWLISLLAK